MKVGEMIDTLSEYLLRCNIDDIPLTVEGVGIYRKGVMIIPANTFDIHPRARTLHLIGDSSSEDPSRMLLLTITGQTAEYIGVRDRIDMLKQLELRALPIRKIRGTRILPTKETLILPTKEIRIPPTNAQDTGGDIHSMLLEILQLLKKIDGKT
jgi:hypothetical protein